jgi:pyruvate,orthophosphate dikinase
MVFGNLDERSGTGVLFSRNPIDGSPAPYGEWLRRGQGEEVVSGRRTPEALEALAQQLPEQHAQLMKLTAELERDGRDAQDIEFTVEAGTLWLLQTRSAKRSPAAAIRLAVALKEEGLIDEELALRRIDSRQVEAVLAPHVDAAALAAATVLARGKPACSGVVSGVLVCNVDEAEQRALDGESIILARPTTDPDDVHAMSVVAGVLTELGGATSHAAVVSREIGVPCVVGCGEASLRGLDQRTVTLDAVNGVVYADALPIHAADSREHADLELLTLWARQQAGGSESSLIELLQRR